MSLNKNARPVLVRLRPDVDESLRAWCLKADRSLSWAVNQALTAWLDLHLCSMCLSGCDQHEHMGDMWACLACGSEWAESEGVAE